MATKFNLFGIGIDALTINEAVDRILKRTGLAGAVYVTKPYVEFLDAARRDPAITQLLNDSWLCLPDGISLIWAAHYLTSRHTLVRWLATIVMIVVAPDRLRSPLPERFGGINFTLQLLAGAEAAGASVFLVGSPQDNSITNVVTTLRQLYPRLRVDGSYPGHIGPSQYSELLQLLRSTRPDLILIGMGFPRQEQLMARLTPELTGGVLIGEGGTFDYKVFGGHLTKAPSWLQHSGLEWLWRLLRQPQRLRRQLAIPRFMVAIYRYGKRG